MNYYSVRIFRLSLVLISPFRDSGINHLAFTEFFVLTGGVCSQIKTIQEGFLNSTHEIIAHP